MSLEHGAHRSADDWIGAQAAGTEVCEPYYPRAVGPIQPLGPSGKFFLALSRLHATRLARVIAIEGTLTPLELQAALRRLQDRHPLMRARILEGATPALAHEVAARVALEVVARESESHWQRVLEDVLEQRTEASSSLFSAHYVYAESAHRGELIFVAEHAVADGVSMNALCAELVALCGRSPTLPARPVQPTLEELLPETSHWQRANSFGTALLRFARVALSRALVPKRSSAQGTAYSFRELTRDETSLLVARAREERTTVTGALLAATMAAASQRVRDRGRLAITVPVDLRSRLASAGLTAQDVGHYTSVVYLSSRAHGTLWPRARALKAQLDQTVTSPHLLAALPNVYRAGRLFMRRRSPPLAHVMVSSSGIVPLASDYGAFRVVGFYSATTAAMLSSDLGFFCNTVQGRLFINLVFSEHVIARSDAELVLDRVVELLTRRDEVP